MEEGQLDGGFLTIDEALTYQQGSREQLCVAMVVDVSMGGDAIAMKPAWQAQNQNLTIAHEATAVGGYMLKRANKKGYLLVMMCSYITVTHSTVTFNVI